MITVKWHKPPQTKPIPIPIPSAVEVLVVAGAVIPKATIHNDTNCQDSARPIPTKFSHVIISRLSRINLWMKQSKTIHRVSIIDTDTVAVTDTVYKPVCLHQRFYLTHTLSLGPDVTHIIRRWGRIGPFPGRTPPGR